MNGIRKSSVSVSCLVGAWLALAPPMQAQNKQDSHKEDMRKLIEELEKQRSEPGMIDPKAEAVLRGFTDRMRSARTLSVDVHITSRKQDEGANLVLETAHAFAVRRPDRISFITERGSWGTQVPVACGTEFAEIPKLVFSGQEVHAADMGATFVSDGTDLYISMPYMGGLGEPTAAVLRNHELISLASLFSLYDIAPYNSHGFQASRILESCLSDDPYGQLMGSTASLKYLGRETIDGAECSKLEYSFPIDYIWLLYVESGDEPVLRVVSSKHFTEAGGGAMKLQFSTRFKNWAIDQELPDDRFKVPPSNAPSDVEWSRGAPTR